MRACEDNVYQALFSGRARGPGYEASGEVESGIRELNTAKLTCVYPSSRDDIAMAASCIAFVLLIFYLSLSQAAECHGKVGKNVL